MPSDLSIEHWLESIHMKDYFPLFMGYEEIDSLFHLKEHDLEKLGVRRAADRQKMLKSLATLRDTAYPGRERTGSRASALRRSGRGTAGQSLDEPQRIVRSNSFKAKVGDFIKGIRKGSKRSGDDGKRVEEVETPAPIENRRQSPGLVANPSSGGVSPASSTHSIENADLDISLQPWFHGMIMRKVADRALFQDGDFLVRESISKPGEHVLTAKWHGKTLHFVVNVVRPSAVPGGGGSLSSREGSPFHNHINRSTGSLNAIGISSRRIFEQSLYRFEKDAFPTIVELINFYRTSQKPVSDRSGCVLKNGVSRETTSHRPPSPLAERRSIRSEPGTPSSKAPDHQASTPNGSSEHPEPVPDSLSPVCRLDPELQRHLPDLDYTRMMCATVLNTVSDELARHLTRADLHVAELLELDWDEEGASKLRKKGKRSSVGSAGGIAGLAAINLPQGKELGHVLLERFHNVSMWTAAVIVGAGDVAKRKNALKKMIELAHHLQSDALVNLHSFMAVMRGLEFPQVLRLKQTWGLLRRNDASTVKSYDRKLRPTATAVAAGNPHMHSVVCLPYLEPMLEMLQRTAEDVDTPGAWEANQDIFALDALNNHLYNCRSLAISCPMYADAGSKRLHGHKVHRDLHKYFKSDWQRNLLLSTMIKPSSVSEKMEKFKIMLTALSEYAEPTQR